LFLQQAKREVRKFVDKMVTGKEAWADIQRMKQIAGQPSGVLSSPLFITVSLVIITGTGPRGANMKELM